VSFEFAGEAGYVLRRDNFSECLIGSNSNVIQSIHSARPILSNHNLRNSNSLTDGCSLFLVTDKYKHLSYSINCGFGWNRKEQAHYFQREFLFSIGTQNINEIK
jgi:hypothetical protein